MAKYQSMVEKVDRTADLDGLVDNDQLTLKTGITGAQAQALGDRLRTDRELPEQAARSIEEAG